MKERKKTTRHLQKIHNRCRVVFSRSFISRPDPVLLSEPSLTEMKFHRNFPWPLSFFGGFPNYIPNRRRTRVYCAGDERAENVRSTSATRTKLATTDLRTELNSRWLLLTATHLRNGAVLAIKLSYSPPSTLHPQVNYAVAFSSGINVFQLNC